MKKYFLIEVSIFFVVILVLGTSIPSLAYSDEKTLSIVSSGNILYVGGSGPGNYSTIQDAVNVTNPGDTVFVYSGTYYENLVINKDSISLVGEDKNTTIIDGSKRENVILILENSIRIKEFTVQNSRNGRFGIAAQILFNPPHNIRDIHISNCIIKNNSCGILFNNVSNSSLINCHLYNLTSQSITIRLLSENIIINNCTINNNGEEQGGGWIHSGCILIDGENNYTCSNINIGYNDIYNIIGDGIVISKSKNVKISHNNIYGNTWDGINLGAVKNCEIRHNIITLNKLIGIIVHGELCSNISIYQNDISHNGVGDIYQAGISLESCSNCVIIRNNNISFNNPVGIHLIGSSDNIFYHNNFIENSQNAREQDYSNNNIWDNGYPAGGNYWDNYTGMDVDGDGIGDTPYNISGGTNQDRYPLMLPFAMTILTIKYAPSFFKSLITIKNVGSTTALNVHWSITFKGGFLFCRRGHSGIVKPLLSHEEITLSPRFFFFGFGHIEIDISSWADNVPIITEKINGFLLFFYFFKR